MQQEKVYVVRAQPTQRRVKGLQEALAVIAATVRVLGICGATILGGDDSTRSLV